MIPETELLSEAKFLSIFQKVLSAFNEPEKKKEVKLIKFHFIIFLMPSINHYQIRAKQDQDLSVP